MKLKFNHFLVASVVCVLALSSSAFADTRIKQNNTTALNLAGSWDTLPTSLDIAQWDNTVTAANSTALGADLSWAGIKIINPTGLVTIGTAATHTLTVGASGIDLSSATQNLLINSNLTAGAAQTWQVAAGRTLQIQTINTNTRLSGSGDIALTNSTGTGTATFDFRPGSSGSTGFNDQNGFYAYTGNWTINTGVFVKTLRNGRNAWGSGTITLNGGTIAQQQNFSGTWTNDIILQTGSNSTIDDANSSGTRSLKLQGVISGDGNLTIAETGAANYAVNGGVILTATNTLSGQVTIAANGVVRVGGVAGATDSSANAGTGGTLGTATVVNNGTLTLSHSDSWTFANNITSGTGAVTIGGSGVALVAGGGTQVVTMSGTHAYTGATIVGAGRLNLTGSLTSATSVASGATLSGTGSTTGLLTMAAGSNLALAGGATTSSLTANGVTFSGATVVKFDTTPTASTLYDVFTYGAGAVTGISNVSVLAHGSLTNDGLGKKYTFAADGAQARTWNTGTGTWEIGGTSSNWAEGDSKFYNADNVTFGDIASDSVVTLNGTLAPASLTVSNAANTYTFSSGSIAGASTLTKSNGSTLVLTSNHSYTGTTTVSGGILQVSNNGTTGSLGSGTVSVASGAELIFKRSDNLTVSNIISGDGIVTKAGAGRMTVNGNNSGGNVHWNFTGTGNGDIGFQNANAIGGTGSTITLAASAAGSAFFANGATSDVGISLGAGSVFTWNGATGNTTKLSGVISGSGGFTKVSGETLILTGTSTAYTGTTTITTGTLQIGDGTTDGSISNSANIVNNAALVYNKVGNDSYANAISGTGTVTKTGDGTQTLSGTNAYTGITTVTAGELVINGSLASSTVNVGASGMLSGIGVLAGAVNVTGVLAPGASVATFATGNLSFTTGSTFGYELDSTVGLGSAADLQLVSGTLNLTGVVNLSLADLASGGTASAFADNTVFTLINYTGAWNSGIFSFGGDALADGDTFTAGLNTWRIDYDAVSGGSNFSDEHVAGNFVNITAIPEPSAALLGGLGLLALLRRRRTN